MELDDDKDEDLDEDDEEEDKEEDETRDGDVEVDGGGRRGERGCKTCSRDKAVGGTSRGWNSVTCVVVQQLGSVEKRHAAFVF